jgi:hypothetical protein
VTVPEPAVWLESTGLIDMSGPTKPQWINRILQHRSILVLSALLLLLGVPWLVLTLISELRQGKTTLAAISAVVMLAALAAATAGIPRIVRNHANFIAVAAGLVSHVLAPNKVSEKLFYELTAQIVPVLFLALAVEARAFERQGGSSAGDARDLGWEWPLGATAAFALLIAGYESLKVLSNGRATTGDFDGVVAALTTATVALTIRALLGPPERRLDRN